MDRLKLSKHRGLKLTRRVGKRVTETDLMDRNFMDKFNFIFGVIQTCALVIGIIVGFIYVAHFSYQMGQLEERVNVLEEMNPIKGDIYGTR